MQGNVVDVFSSLAGATGLRNLYIYRNPGLTGPLVPPGSPQTGPPLCQLAGNALLHLDASYMQLTGPIPACLLGPGSHLVYLYMSETA